MILAHREFQFELNSLEQSIELRIIPPLIHLYTYDIAIEAFNLTSIYDNVLKLSTSSVVQLSRPVVN